MHTPEINRHTVDLIHTHWKLTIQPWTVLYPSKGGPVLNVFLCYLRSHGHNKKTRTSSFGNGSVSSFPLLFTHTHVRFQVFTNPRTYRKSLKTKKKKRFVSHTQCLSTWFRFCRITLCAEPFFFFLLFPLPFSCQQKKKKKKWAKNIIKKRIPVFHIAHFLKTKQNKTKQKSNVFCRSPALVYITIAQA